MQYLEPPLWLAQQAWGAICYFWPVTLGLAIPFVITLALKSPFIGREAKFCLRHLSVLLPMTMTLLILILGTAMEHTSDSQSLAPNWPADVVQSLLAIQFVASIWAVWFMKGYRLFSLFTVMLELWFALACTFVASMFVTGDWL